MSLLKQAMMHVQFSSEYTDIYFQYELLLHASTGPYDQFFLPKFTFSLHQFRV